MKARVSVAVVVVAGLFTACAREQPRGVTVLTYASQYSPAHPFSRADIAWMQWIAARSAGHLRIQPYWSGEQGLFHRDTRYLSKIVAAHLRRPAAVAEFECS